MGVILNKRISKTSELAIWRIEESVQELYGQLQLNSEETAFFESLKKENRRLEWLASRVLLRKLINHSGPIELDVDEHSKPYLVNMPHYFSLSHSSGYAAVLISSTHPVGIDIEKMTDKVVKVKEKFLSGEELAFIDPKEIVKHLYACWSAKEALYKLYGKREVSLKEQIRLQAFPIQDSGSIQAAILMESKAPYAIYYEIFHGCMLSYVLECVDGNSLLDDNSA